MSAPNSPNIVSVPAHPGQPWDATSDSSIGGWDTLDRHAGPVSLTTGRGTGEDFPSGSGWKQV